MPDESGAYEAKVNTGQKSYQADAAYQTSRIFARLFIA
jgi:hypothetical protein